MSVFNSLGSNYNLDFVLKALFASGSNKSRQDLEKYLENKYRGDVVLLYKGREAIELALKILKLAGSEVAINGFTCFAVFEAIKKAGLKAVYLDIGKEGLNFSAQTLKEALQKNPNIKVAIIQNTLGYPCNINEISKICKQKNIILIEDLAHSIGAKYSDNSEAGTVGDFTVLSFSQDKMIDAISGGALIIRNQLYKESLNDLKQLDQKNQTIDRLYPLFTFLIRTAYSFRLGKLLHLILKKLSLLSKPMQSNHGILELPNWYCNLILNQFEKLQDDLNHHLKIAKRYASSLDSKLLLASTIKQIDLSSNLRFPVIVEAREKLIKYLAKHQIFISDIWYDAPIGPKKYLALTDYQNQCPNSEHLSSKIINLPTHINIGEEDAENIVQLINQWIRSK